MAISFGTATQAVGIVGSFLSNKILSVSYDTKAQISGNIGLPEDQAAQIDKNYIVTITETYVPLLGSTTTPATTFKGFLQKNIELQTGSNWDRIGTLGDNGPETALVKKFIGAAGVSTEVAGLTRRKWTGSDPLVLRIELVLETYDNSTNEVLKPCAFLQALTLPMLNPAGASLSNFVTQSSRGIPGIGTAISNISKAFGNSALSGAFLIPPGPNPYSFGTTATSGSLINIKIGSYLTFKNVVVDSVIITYHNRMGVDGPIGAKAVIKFSTYEILTRNALQDAYGGKVSIVPNWSGKGILGQMQKTFNDAKAGLGGGTNTNAFADSTK